MEFIAATSGKLYFKDIQPQRGEPRATLVLMHGAGGSHLSWRRQFDDLSREFRVIAIDLPGHGMSDGNGEVTIGAHERCVTALINSLGLEQVVLGGHSMGGAIALEMAMKDPDRVEALMLVGSGARLRVLPAIFSMIRENFEVAVEGVTNFVFSPHASPELVNEEKNLLRKASPDVLIKDFAACDSFDMMDKLGTVRAPVLIACGKDDRLTPPKYSEYMHEKLACSDLVLFDECGHMAMLEKSVEFNQCVSSFLAKLH
jgi:pimeloyl-ACP methyl ester carboxylesterase